MRSNASRRRTTSKRTNAHSALLKNLSHTRQPVRRAQHNNERERKGQLHSDDRPILPRFPSLQGQQRLPPILAGKALSFPPRPTSLLRKHVRRRRQMSRAFHNPQANPAPAPHRAPRPPFLPDWRRSDVDGKKRIRLARPRGIPRLYTFDWQLLRATTLLTCSPSYLSRSLEDARCVRGLSQT